MSEDSAAVERIRTETDPRARAALIAAFVTAKEPLIRMLAEKYARIEKTEADLDDIHQAGRLGFSRALETWDSERSEITTWAGWGIRRAVQDLAHVERTIKLPQIRGTSAERERIMRAVRENPDVTAAELGVPDSMLERLKQTSGLRFVSVDMFGPGDEDSEGRARRIERRLTQATDDGEDAESELDARNAVSAACSAVHRCAAALRLGLEDVLVGLARALALPAPYAERVMPSAKKTSHAAPHPKKPVQVHPCPKSPPPSSPPSRLKLRPLPLPPRKSVDGRPERSVARAPRSLPRRALRRLPLPLRRPRPIASAPTSSGSSESSASPRRSRISILPTAPKSSPPSRASRKAA